MSETLNLTSEMHHKNIPNSCIMNSLLYDENSVVSICSQRAGSVTVAGKRQSALNCASPNHEKKKFSIPVQTLSRIKSQNSQVKKILYKKSVKCSNNQPLSPRSKGKAYKNEENLEKAKEDGNNRVNSAPKYALTEDSTKFPISHENLSVKTQKTFKMSGTKEQKIKFPSKFDQKLKREINMQVKLDLVKFSNKGKNTKNSASEGKMISPRLFKNELKKTFKKTSKKSEKKHLENTNDSKTLLPSKKATVEFSKIINSLNKKALNLKNSSSSREISGILSLKINSELKEKKKKNQAKKIKKVEKNENIFLDLKKTKILEQLKKGKSKEDILKKIHKFKKISFKKSCSGRHKKSIDFDRLEKSEEQLKLQGINETLKKELQKSGSFTNSKKEKSAILIQSHIRKFLAQKKFKKTKETYSLEDAEVKNIIKTWQKESSGKRGNENYMDHLKKLQGMEHAFANKEKITNLQKLKNEEINEIKNIIENSEKNCSIIDVITQIIDNRYRNIEKIMQISPENEDIEESQDFLHLVQNKNFSKIFETANLDSAIDKNWATLNENDLNTKANSETPPKYDSKLNTNPKITPSESNPIQDLINPSLTPFEKFETQNSTNAKTIVSVDLFFNVSEIILNKILNEEIEKYKHPVPSDLEIETSLIPVKKVENFDSCINLTLSYLDKIHENIFQALSKPLRKNPLEVLAKLQMPYLINPLIFDFSSMPSIFSLEKFSEFFISHVPNNDSLQSQLKMLVDVSSELLNSYRPYSISGVPMPWSSYSSISIHNFGFSKQKKNKLDTLSRFKKNFCSLNKICAGRIPDNSYIDDLSLDEEKLQTHREEKIGVLISHDIHSNEVVWTDYRFEECHVKICVSDKIFENLLEEIMLLLQN